MKNITVSVDEATYRRARAKAAERDTSVSALVREFLRQVVTEETTTEALRRKERQLKKTIKEFRGGNRLSRDDLHAR